MTTRILLPILLSSLISCDEDIIVEETYCALEITELPALESEQEQNLYAHPLSEVWDTFLSIDGKQAEIIDINRSGCSTCDTCRIENQCNQCEECTICDTSCIEEQCIEVLHFITPTLSEDSATLRLINKYGQSAAYTVEVIE